ncbi:MAG TPA: ABATE domain-containing protein, partial [Longimicrobiales bacterium]|nr:ABATE domain-containing protein [Longimicrobiales bacterium]
MAKSSVRHLIAGHPALDFTNTVDWHAGPNAVDRLHTYDDLLDWARHAKVLGPAQLTRLRRRAAAVPAQARESLADAIATRELIYRIFTAAARGKRPARADLAELHA